MNVLVFQGGEAVVGTGEGNNVISISDWSEDSIKKGFIEYFGDGWADEDTGDMYSGDPITLPETVDVVNDSMAQCTTCGDNGGMTYMVKC